MRASEPTTGVVYVDVSGTDPATTAEIATGGLFGWSIFAFIRAFFVAGMTVGLPLAVVLQLARATEDTRMVVGAPVQLAATLVLLFYFYHKERRLPLRRLSRTLPLYSKNLIDIFFDSNRWFGREGRPSGSRQGRGWAAFNFLAALSPLLLLIPHARSFLGLEEFAYWITEDENVFGLVIMLIGFLMLLLFINGVRLAMGGAPAIHFFAKAVLFGGFAKFYGLMWLMILAGSGAVIAGSVTYYILPADFKGTTGGIGGTILGALMGLGLSGCIGTYLAGLYLEGADKAEDWYRASAAKVTSNDTRPPILLLRAFRDDALTVPSTKPQEGTQSASRLEDVISRTAWRYGPFVAVAQPGKARASGAARNFYGNDQWQAAVRDWMDKARFIVAVARWSEGLEWELRTVITRTHARKLILVVPPSSHRFLLNQERVAGAFEGSPWGTSIAQADLYKALVLHLTPDDRLVVIKGDAGSDGEILSAINVAIYGMFVWKSKNSAEV